MFAKVDRTQHPPEHFEMIWDGTCGFCKYWVINWKSKTGDKVHYAPYQKAAQRFPDIPEQYFKEAVRLIGPDGVVYSGPHAAYKSMALAGEFAWALSWYEHRVLFRTLSDTAYQWLADHRPFAMRLTKWMFGKNPVHQRPYWLFYLMIAVALALVVST